MGQQFICIPTVLLDGSERVARPIGYIECNGTLAGSDFASLIDTAEIHTLTYQIKDSRVINPVGLALFTWGTKQVGFPVDLLSLGDEILTALIAAFVTPIAQETTDKKIDIVGLYLGRKYHIRGYVPAATTPAVIGGLLDILVPMGVAVSYVTLQNYKDHNSTPIAVDWKTSVCSYWSDTDKGVISVWHEPDADVDAFMAAALSKLRTPLGTTPTAYQLV